MLEILSRAPNRQAGQDAAYKYVLDSLARTVIRQDGTISETALQKWTNNRKGMLSQIPEIAQEVDDLLNQVRTRADTSKFLREDAKQLANTERDFNRSALAMFVGKEPEKSVAALLASDDPVGAVKELRGLIGGDRAADEGLRAAVLII